VRFPPEVAEFLSRSEEQTREYGRRLASLLPRPALILLSGELGSGKTALVKGLAAGLKVAAEDDVASPTYTLIHEYQRDDTTLFHVDLYRLETLRELSTLGLEDILGSASQHAIVAIEWGKKFNLLYEWPRLEIELLVVSDNERLIRAQWMQVRSAGESADTLGAVRSSNKTD
jgi:tRNA threonylcarbamoyladenosine biosynthesis protein TsaE